MTAEELLTELNKDPAYLQRKAHDESALERSRIELSDAEAPLVKELGSVGITVSSVWDLVNTSSSYKLAIPTLLKHLRMPYPDAIIAGIARALGTQDAREYGWKIIVDQYVKTDPITNPRAKEGLAVALAGASDDSVIGDLVDLVTDEKNGQSRVLLLLGLRRSKVARARQAILALSRDPQFMEEIRSWQIEPRA
jgi:hypothetical protein